MSNCWVHCTVIRNTCYICNIRSRHIANTLYCNVRWSSPRRINVIINSNYLIYFNEVTAVVFYSVCSCDYFRTSISIRGITHMSNCRVHCTVVRNTCYVCNISSRYISNTLYSNIRRGCTRRVNVIINSNHLIYFNEVTTVIFYSIRSCNDFRTSISVRGITHMCNCRVNRTVIRNTCYVCNICCWNISNALH